MKISKLTYAVAMSLMMLVALPSCDKDEVNKTEEQQQNPEPQNVASIDAATISKKVTFPNDGSISQVLYSDQFKDFTAKVAKFANNAAIKIGVNDGENTAVSPISIFMALAMSAECANGDTRQELLDAMGVTYDELHANIRALCYTFNKALGRNDDGSVSNFIKCVNSFWLRKDVANGAKDDGIKALNTYYYADMLKMDFETTDVNDLIKSYISNETNGLLQPEFNYDENTAILLMNVIYLREIWNELGENLPLTDDKYDFLCYNQSKVNTQLLQGDYNSGRAVETEKFRKFMTETNRGLQLTFFVPKDDYTLDDIYTSDILNDPTPYTYADEAAKKRYYTRCFFPTFEAEYNKDIKNAIAEMGVDKFFTVSKCDFTNLTDHEVYCRSIRHVTKLEVARKGIEGAAVTVVEMADKASGEPYDEEWENVFEDFIVDRNFAYVLSMDGVPVFTGVVKSIK